MTKEMHKEACIEAMKERAQKWKRDVKEAQLQKKLNEEEK
jgi:hypothetical protein